jgi:acetyltransferase
MAIHPYPVELESEAVLREGTRVAIRPIRPEDVELETRFFEGLSEQSRYQRFMQQLPHLPPKMLARFTHIDYDRELALVALHGGEFIAVGRYAPNPDGKTAEFALVVADDWQGKGLGRILLKKLREQARKTGYCALFGNILAANHAMLDLALQLGFELQSREGADVTVVSRLS